MRQIECVTHKSLPSVRSPEKHENLSRPRGRKERKFEQMQRKNRQWSQKTLELKKFTRVHWPRNERINKGELEKRNYFEKPNSNIWILSAIRKWNLRQKWSIFLSLGEILRRNQRKVFIDEFLSTRTSANRRSFEKFSIYFQILFRLLRSLGYSSLSAHIFLAVR